MESKLKEALSNPIWINDKMSDLYNLKGSEGVWKITYYPIFECGKTGKQYEEPRALVESKIKNGTDFREVPLRYLEKIKKRKQND